MITAGEAHLDFERWREAVSQAFVPLDAAPLPGRATTFQGGLSSRAVGDLQLSEVSGRATRVTRSTRSIRNADPGVIKVALQCVGVSTVVQHDREATLAPGDLVAYDTSAPYDLAFAGSFGLLVAVLPRETLRVGDHELADATARPISTRAGVGALLRPLLTELGGDSLDATASTPLVADAVADLVSAALRAATPDRSLGVGESILLSARAYIESNLGDTRLCPADLAAAHHVSLRYLQKLFAQDGHTVAGFIRQRRLDRCRRDLADPTQAHRSVGSIGASYGLIDAAHFSRIFKDAYGVSPRRYRESAGDRH